MARRLYSSGRRRYVGTVDFYRAPGLSPLQRRRIEALDRAARRRLEEKRGVQTSGVAGGGGFGGFLANLGRDVLDIVTGVPSALQLVGKSLWYPVALGLEQAGGVSRSHRAGIERQLRTAGRAIAEDYSTRWGPLFRGDFDEFRRQIHEHPGVFALDVGAGWSGAGALVAGGARAAVAMRLASATGRVARIGERSVLREGTHRIGGREVYSTGARYRPPRRYELRLGENTGLGRQGPAVSVIEEARRAYSRNPLTRAVQKKVLEPAGRTFSRFLEEQGNLAREGAGIPGARLLKPFSTTSRFNRAAGRLGRDMRYEAELTRARRLRELSDEYLTAIRQAEREYGSAAAPAIYLHLRDLLNVPGKSPSQARKAVADFMERGLARMVQAGGVRTRGASRTIRDIEDVPERLLTLEGNPTLARAVEAGRELSRMATEMRVRAGTISPQTASTIGRRAAEMVFGGSRYDPNYVRPTERVLAARERYARARAARMAGPKLAPMEALRRSFAGGRQAGRGDAKLAATPRGRRGQGPREGIPRASDIVQRPDEVPAGRGVLRGQRVMPEPEGEAVPAASPAEALRRQIEALESEAKALEARYSKRLRQRGRELRDYREGTAKRFSGPQVGRRPATEHQGNISRNLRYEEGGRPEELAARDRYAYNVRDPERYREGGGRKSLADHEQDFLAMIRLARERGMKVDPEDLQMLEDAERAAELSARAAHLGRELDVFEGPDWLYDQADIARAEAAGRAAAEALGLTRSERPAVRFGRPEQMTLYGRRSRGPIPPSDARIIVNAPVGPRLQRAGIPAARARAYGQVLRGEGRLYRTRVELRESRRLSRELREARRELAAAEREARGGFTPPSRTDVGLEGVYVPDRPAGRLAVRSTGEPRGAFGRLTQDKVHESHGTLFGMGNVSLDPKIVVQALDRALVDDMHPGFIRTMVDAFAFKRNGQVAQGDRALMAMEADPQNVVLVSRKRLEDAMRLSREAPEGTFPDDPFRGMDILEGEAGLAAAKEIPQQMRGDVIAIPKAAIEAVRSGYGPGRQWAIYDTPLQLWRRGILAFAPRWYLNNLFGNTLQFGLLTGFDLRALAAARRKRIGEAVPERIGGSTVVQETRIADPTQVGPARAAYERATNFGMDLNHRFESWIRRAAFLSRMKRGLRPVGIDPFKLPVDEVKRLIDDLPEELMDEVLRDTELFMGNYVRMAPWERAYLKRIFPFYSWMRVIGRFMGAVPIQHPKRAAVTAAVSRAATEAVNPEDFMLPLYDRGRVNLPGGLAWRTFSANPFTTHAELIANVAGGNPFNIVGGLARDITPIAGQQLVQIVSGRNPFGREFTAPPGYGGAVQAFGFSPQEINPATGLPEETRPVPPISELVLQTIPLAPQLIRGLAAGGRVPYDTTSTFDLITRSKPDWMLFRDAGQRPSEPLMVGPVPVNPFLSILGLNTIRRDRAAERERYRRIFERYRQAQAQTQRRIARASRS